MDCRIYKKSFSSAISFTQQTTTAFLKTNVMKQIKLYLLTAFSPLFIAAWNFSCKKEITNQSI
jgi:hypothetical protein